MSVLDPDLTYGTPLVCLFSQTCGKASELPPCLVSELHPGGRTNCTSLDYGLHEFAPPHFFSGVGDLV